MVATEGAGHVDNSSDQLGLESGRRELVSAHELGLAEPLAVDEERAGGVERRSAVLMGVASGRRFGSGPADETSPGRVSRSPPGDGGAAFAAGGGAHVDGLPAGGADPQAGLELDVRRRGRVAEGRYGPPATRRGAGRSSGPPERRQVVGGPLLDPRQVGVVHLVGPRFRIADRSWTVEPSPTRRSRAPGRPARSPGTCPLPDGPTPGPSADGRTGRRSGRSRPPSRWPFQRSRRSPAAPSRIRAAHRGQSIRSGLLGWMSITSPQRQVTWGSGQHRSSNRALDASTDW